jgi:hypothetical protein
MMMRECTSTCFVLFWIVVVPASDPKDLFVEHVTMFTFHMISWVGPARFESSRSGLGYAPGAKPMCMVWLHVGYM